VKLQIKMRKVAFILLGISLLQWALLLSCKKEKESIPTLATLLVSNITNSSAQSGGFITNDGGTPVTQRGIVWSTRPNPTTAGNSTNDGSGKGNFSSNVTGLIANTTYYVRAYATNAKGTAYGE